MSVVFRCRMADGRGAVLKVRPDRARLADEAAALEGWHTVHTPAVLALDEQLGALLLEAIEPGTPLVVSSTYPDLEGVGELLSSPHTSSVPDPTYPTVRQRVAYLFDSPVRLYDRHPELTALLPPELYERGHRLAIRLAAATSTHAARLLGWCTAFAGMIALELASQGIGARPATAALLGLAAQAPTD
jgi:streptomycin 6-kinase